MIIALSILGISLVVMVGLVQFKLVELRTGRSYLFFNEKSDRLVGENLARIKKLQKHWNPRIFQSLYHFVLDKFEEWLLYLYRYLRRKFDKPVSLVKGQGSPYSGEKKDNGQLPG